MPPMFRRFAVLMLVALLAAFLPLADSAYAATRHVTNTNDSGTGSLRDAMTNAVSGDTIVFDNAGALWTIQPTSPLPTLDNGGVTIDGGADHKIVLDGSQIQSEPQYNSFSSNGIKITSSNNTVKGLVIIKFPLETGIPRDAGGAGVYIAGTATANASGNRVIDCWIGVASDGTTAQPNAYNGVLIDNRATNNTIGGTTAGEGNVISGNGNTSNGGANVEIGQETFGLSAAAITGNSVVGNLIGTNTAGTAAITGGNPGDGVVLGAWAQNNTVGGTTAAARNVIAGNSFSNVSRTAAGVAVAGQAGVRPNSGNIIAGNYIGVGSNGTTVIANGDGVVLNGVTGTTIGGATASTRNIISGNNQSGVSVQTTGTNNNTIANNYIGLDAAGAARGNAKAGVLVSTSATGTTIGPGNVISANGVGANLPGVHLKTAGNTVKGNFIGTNAAGTAPIPNGLTSVLLEGVSNNTIGGATAADRNVIALGNFGWAINITNASSGNFIYGNYIGVNASGSAPLVATIPVDSVGVQILSGSNNQIGGAAAGTGNVIGGVDVGIKLQSASTTGSIIKRNSIGVGAAGQNVGNGLYGIWVLGGSTTNTIGGTLGTEGNLIANNGFDGIFVDTGANGNTIAGNTVRNNAVNGIRVRGATGIKITQTQTSDNTSGPGITLVSSGNANLAAPFGLQFTSPGGTPTLSGNACNNCAIEVFTSATRDDGEGPRYLATTTAGAGGAFSVAIPGCDQFLTATARDASNNTSPFTAVMIDAGNGCQSPQPHVQLDPASPSARTVAPGATATYQHKLTNSGTGSGTFTIDRSSTQAGWTIQHSPAGPLTLAAGQFRTIYVTVTVPLGTTIPNSDQTTITASVGSESASRTDTTTVQQVGGVNIAPPRSGQATPGAFIDYTHYITNTGNGTDTFLLSATHSAPSVSVSFPDGQQCTSLAPGAFCTRRVRVTVAPSSTDLADTTIVTATSQLPSAARDSVSDVTQIRQSPIPQITPDAQTKNALPPATVTFTHTVRNIGGATGQFTVTLQNSPPAGWNFNLSTPTSFSLTAGASRTITLTVTVPAGANAGTDVTANLKVDSSSGASVTAADTTHVLLSPAFTFSAATQTPVNGLPGDTVTFTHTLTNQANGPDSFTIVLTSTAGLTNLSFTSSPSLTNLPKGQSAQVVVRATIASGTLAGPQQIGVTAQRTSAPQLPIKRLDNVNVQGAAVPQLTTAAPQTPALPLPRTITFTHTLKNIGNMTGNFTVGATAPSGWSPLTSSPACLTALAPNATCQFTVQVTVPAGALSKQYQVVVTASSPDDSTSVLDLVNVPAIPGLLFAPDRNGNADPSTVFTYTHTLTNTGNITDSFTIVPTFDPGWSAVVSPQSVPNVPPGGVRTVQVGVRVPGGLIAGSTGAVTATATSALTPFPSARVVDRTTVNAKAGATLIPAQQSLSANPTDTLSDTVTFQHTLRNTGSVAITYTLTTSHSGPSWTTVVTPTQAGPLAPGAQTTIAVRVTVPAGTPFGEVMTTTLHAQQLGGPTGDLATAQDISRVGPQFGALLTPPLNRRSALPGMTVVYTHTLHNSGLDEDTFLLSTIAPNGWDTRVAPSSVSLPRNGSTIITVTVQVPTSALSTTLTFPPDLATVRAQSVNDIDGFGTAQEETTVRQVAGVSLSPPRLRTATPGRTITFQHTLLNTGNGLDTFDLTWTITGTGVLTWAVSISPASEMLLPGDSDPVVMVSVQVPPDATPDAIGRIVVTARSRSNPQVIDRLEDLLVGPAQLAAEERIYLPAVMR